MAEELLSGGLVTSKDEAELQPGELSVAQNLVHLPETSYVAAFEGHRSAGTVDAGQAVYGLRDAKFDNGDHYVIAAASTRYRRSAVGDTLTFSDLDTGVTAGTSLEALQSENQYVLLNGANANRVMYLSATAPGTVPSIRPHGLDPVTALPGLSTATGLWPVEATGWFEFWTTEIVEYTKDGTTFELESTCEFPGDPASVFVSSAATQVLIARPAIRNTAATHWRAWRSTKKDRANDKRFPLGFLASPKVPTATLTYSYGTPATVGFIAATSTASNTGWVTPLNASSSNNAYAQATSVNASVVYNNFGLGAAADPIAGIEVEIEGKRTGAGFVISAALSWDGGTSYTSELVSTISGTTVDVTTTLGSATFLWFRTWHASELTDGNFRVRLTTGTQGSGSIDVDLLRVRVHYNGSADDADGAGTPFPAVIVSIGGVDQSVGSHGKPPRASTGDLFNGAAVTNDVDNPSHVVWTLAGGENIDYRPAIYFNDLETPENDQVTLIRTINNICVVCTRASKFRMNYVPSEEDAQFHTAKAFEQFDPQHGAVNPMAGCMISGPDGHPALLTCAFDGVFLTDGYAAKDWTGEFDWSALRDSIGDLTTGIKALTNDPARWEAQLHYLEGGIPKSLRFNYHPRHLRPGNLPKLSGPCIESTPAAGTDFDITSAWNVRRSTGALTRYLGTSAGTVRRNPREAGVDTFADMIASTRRIFAEGIGTEFTVGDAYLFGVTGAASSTIELDTIRSNAPSETFAAKTFPNFKLAHVDMAQGVEGGRFTLRNSATTAYFPKWGKLGLEGVDFGREDSGA